MTQTTITFAAAEIHQTHSTPGSVFWHKGTRHVLVSQERNFVGSRCLIEAINCQTGMSALIFADEIR